MRSIGHAEFSSLGLCSAVILGVVSGCGFVLGAGQGGRGISDDYPSWSGVGERGARLESTKSGSPDSGAVVVPGGDRAGAIGGGVAGSAR